MSTLEESNTLREPLHLPEYQHIHCRYETGMSGLYGALAVAASYCGLATPPGWIRGQWMHGWQPSYREKLHPDLYMGARTNPGDQYFVDRKDAEDFFRGRGYGKVRAIGLPMVYLPRIEAPRRPGSLLVMPAHSIEFTTHSWKFEEYAEAIAAIRSDFEEVVVCLHSSCWNRGYWVDAFRRRGFPLIKGADKDDRNGLGRIQALLSTFEYVTTNNLGSQVAYAAYFGARPSIYGPYATFRFEDLKHDPTFASLPRKLVERALQNESEEEVRRHHPRLFCHPREAEAAVDWARFELGEANKVPPHEMRSLFGWDAGSRLKRSLVVMMPGGVEHWARTLLKTSYREGHRREVETRRLLAMPPRQPTRTDLLGPALEIDDGPRFVEKKRLLFDQGLYRFIAEDEAPRILDCGAGIGLSVCYFKRLYPKSRLTAFEPDPRRYEILKRNCESWGAGDVELLPRAIWDHETTLPFAGAEGYARRLREQAVGDQSVQVPTCRLRDYLGEMVDLLRLNIEGAEVDVLLDCSDRLDRVRNLIVDYHSILERPQRFDALIGVLSGAGFRMDFRSNSHSPTPLVYRYAPAGIESKLSIFAYRA